MKYKILLFFILFALVSCKTRTIVEYRDSNVNTYGNSIVHDTITVHNTDSVFVELRTSGDTVYVTKYKEVIRWKDKVSVQIDTCFRDTTRVEYIEKTKEIKYIPKIYKISLWFSILLIIFAIVKLALWLKSKSVL